MGEIGTKINEGAKRGRIAAGEEIVGLLAKKLCWSPCGAVRESRISKDPRQQ